jgi:hypothetical protein
MRRNNNDSCSGELGIFHQNAGKCKRKNRGVSAYKVASLLSTLYDSYNELFLVIYLNTTTACYSTNH